ncbi:hypothetical protein CSAL01_03446 [Colletotrichum salicis]|uniref:Uncharacterized protein n=1 Tax=Colletotrichum salicis TaxID=1209931 RepID=A0A135UL06_9PEZI|nr:hypothetical protein CSAL01_03446 [Colletotrichum salicis]
MPRAAAARRKDIRSAQSDVSLWPDLTLHCFPFHPSFHDHLMWSFTTQNLVPTLYCAAEPRPQPELSACPGMVAELTAHIQTSVSARASRPPTSLHLIPPDFFPNSSGSGIRGRAKGDLISFSQDKEEGGSRTGQ